MRPKHAVAVLAIVAIVAVAPSALATCHSCVSLGGGSAGPIVVPSGDTMPKGTYGLSFNWSLDDFKAWSDARLDQFAMDGETAMSMGSSSSTTLTFDAGLTDDVTLGVRLQGVTRDAIRMVEEDPMSPGMYMVMDHGDASGLGDTMISVQWRFARTSAISASLLAGIEVPTGKTSVTGMDGMRLDADHQPGSGSWDGLIGLAASHSWTRSSLHGSVAWMPNGYGTQDSRLGDATFAGIAWAARLGKLPAEGAKPATRWDSSVELTAENRGKSILDGEKVARGSGTILLLTPGVRLSIHDEWYLQGAWGIPLSDDTNGNTVETSSRVNLGFGRTW